MKVYIKSLSIAVLVSVIVTFLFRNYLNNIHEVPEIVEEEKSRYDMVFQCTKDEDQKGNISETIQAFEKRIQPLTNRYELRQISPNSFYAKLFQVSDTEFLKTYLLTSLSLSFQEVYTISELSPLFESINDLTRPPQKTKDSAMASDKLTEVLKDTHVGFGEIFFNKVKFIEQDHALGLAIVNIKDTAWVDSVFNLPLIRKKIPRDLKFMYGKYQPPEKLTYSESKLTLYAIRFKPDNKLNENSIANAYLDYDKRSINPSIQIEFNHTGTYLFAELTHANINKPIALIIGQDVFIAAWVTSVVENGKCIFSGGFTVGECDQFCKRVLAGNLPSSIHGSVKITPIKEEKTTSGHASPLKYMLVIFFAAFIISFLATFLIFRTLSPV